MSEDVDDSRGTLGTFAGVFTPSILTILGIILFLRLGYVVGNAGLRNALIIIAIANGVSILTSLSVAAIATNIDVKGGGDYYMISRTLGVEFGGAIGQVLFLAQSVSIAFYAVGFGEALTSILGIEAGWGPQLVAAVAVVALFGLAWLGADAASRFQFVVMALLVAALISFYVGAVGGFESAQLSESWARPEGSLGFWAVFAIFFPAVTGFTQGVSMSGDLKNPGRSIPVGTFAAVGLSLVIYFSVALLIAGNASTGLLQRDNAIMNSVAAVRPLVDLGVVAATLSSAMASFLGAPRILQSLASDRIFPLLTFFAKGHGPTSNPRRAVALSLVIALGTVAVGNLNAIAPIVSMFFLISYGLLNYATYFEARAASPSFRPRFRFFDRRVSLTGTFVCFGAMLAINAVAGGIALVLLMAIHQYLRRVDRPQRWTDSNTAFHFQRAKESIAAMRTEVPNARSWRPQILAFSADHRRRERLLDFASWLEGSSGMTAMVEIIVGEGAVKRRDREHRQRDLEAEIGNSGFDVHARAVLAPDAMEALPVIVQSFGLGPLRANTVLFGWPENDDPHHLGAYSQAVREVQRLGVNVVNMLSDEERWARLGAIEPRLRRIDVWWQGDDASRLALLSAYLFTRTKAWAQGTIRVLSIPDTSTDPEVHEQAIRDLLHEARISATVHCAPQADIAAIVDLSSDAAFVLVPVTMRRGDFSGPFGLTTADLLVRLPSTAAILAGAPVELITRPESAHHAQMREAEERVEVIGLRLRTLERMRPRLEMELQTRSTADSSPEDVSAARHRLATLERRILVAQAKLERARAELETLFSRDDGSNHVG